MENGTVLAEVTLEGNVMKNMDSQYLRLGRISDRRRAVIDIMESALEAACPRAATQRALANKDIFCQSGRHIFVSGAGKAASSMAAAASAQVTIHPSSFILTKDGHSLGLSEIEEWEASHPVPDARGVEGTTELLRRIEALPTEIPVLFLLSGGASSLLCSPKPQLSLEDMQTTTALLLREAIGINEINVVRKHLSQVKGGQLARLIEPRPLLTLVLSDVIGDDLSSIGSGPTTPDPTTWHDVMSICKGSGVFDRLPTAVQQIVIDGIAGRVPETPKFFATDQAIEVVGSNTVSLDAAAHRAESLGFIVSPIATPLTSELCHAEAMLKDEILRVKTRVESTGQAECVLVGGEITVRVNGNGRGGRNQELAARLASGIPDESIVLGTLATDGTDGPTDAAGGVVDFKSALLWKEQKIDSEIYLADNNSYPLLESSGDLLFTGPTGTNVNDIVVALIYPK